MTITMTEPTVNDLLSDNPQARQAARELIPAGARSIPLLAAVDAWRELAKLCDECGGLIWPGQPSHYTGDLRICVNCAPDGRCPRCGGDGFEEVEMDHYGSAVRSYVCSVCSGQGWLA